MFCANCGSELRETDRFCSQCGRAARTGFTPGRRLTLAREGKKIAGVCAGFARYFDMDVTLMRILWLVFAVTTVVGVLAYPIAWLLMPPEANAPGTAAPAPRAM
jgi:phage shock protein C